MSLFSILVQCVSSVRHFTQEALRRVVTTPLPLSTGLMIHADSSNLDKSRLLGIMKAGVHAAQLPT